MSTSRAASYFLLLLALPLALSACSGGGSKREPLPTIKTFTVASERILIDESTELTWDVSDASEVSLEPGLGVHPPTGRLLVKPDTETRYRLVAKGREGTRSAELSVKVIQYDWSKLAAELARHVGDTGNKVAGYSFALAVGGRTVFVNAGGNLQADSRVPITSATKAASSAAILTLVQEGKLDLDAPIGNYLGALWPDTAPLSAITTRMLLNHMSGLPFTADCLDERRGMTLGDCVKEISGLPLRFTPGEAFLYSNTGYQVAGLIAEKISGLAWADFFNEHLGGRLGLLSYSYLGTSNPRIGGGAVSDAVDHLKLQQLFLDDGKAGPAQVLSAEIAAALKQSQIAGKRVESSPLPSGSGLAGYSFGWWISNPANHPGSKGPELSDPGSLGTTPWLDYDKGYAAVLLLNKDSRAGLEIWNAVRPLILDQINRNGTPSG